MKLQENNTYRQQAQNISPNEVVKEYSVKAPTDVNFIYTT